MSLPKLILIYCIVLFLAHFCQAKPNVTPVITACRTSDWVLVEGVIWEDCEVQWQVIYNFKEKNYINKFGIQMRKVDGRFKSNHYLLRKQK